MPRNSRWLVLAIAAAILPLPLRISAYSSGAPLESCYSMSPIHTDPITNTIVPSIPCGNNSNCDGLTLTVTHNGESDGYYRCNEYHQGKSMPCAFVDAHVHSNNIHSVHVILYSHTSLCKDVHWIPHPS